MTKIQKLSPLEAMAFDAHNLPHPCYELGEISSSLFLWHRLSIPADYHRIGPLNTGMD
jgi:hypothetical protein